MKHFCLELRDLDDGEFWRNATVFYEDGAVCAIEDEDGRELSLKDLTSHDRALVERSLIYNLAADEAGKVYA